MSGSSRKRKKRSPRKSELTEFADKQFAAKKLNSDGIDLKFLILGMVTTLMIGLLGYGKLTASPATGRILAATDPAEALAEVKSVDERQFDEVVASGNSEQLQNVLKSLNQWVPDPESDASISEKTNESVKKNQRIIDVSNKMMTMTLNREQRELAISSKFEALEAIYGLTFLDESTAIPNVVQELKAFGRKHENDSNLNLRRQAQLSLVKVNSFESSREENPDFDEISNQICTLMKTYPNDDVMLGVVDSIVRFFRIQLGREIGDKISSRLEARKDEFTSPKILALLYDFSDETKLADSNYLQLFEDRWVDGSRGQQELLKRSIELVNDHDPGRTIIANVDLVALWFEQEGMYESAREIYKAIADSADRYKSADVAAIAKLKAQYGFKRLDMVGKTLDFTAKDFNGRLIPKEEFDKKVVVVIFWSNFNPESRRVVGETSHLSTNWNDRGVRVLAVNVDRNIDNIDKEFLLQISKVETAFCDPENNYSNNILEQCPSDEVPRIMLVKQDGTVADINVPVSELDTEIDFLTRN